VPELPETETIARDLNGALRGAVVRSARVIRPDVLRGIGATAFARAFENTAIVRVHRRAKSVVIELASRAAGARSLVVTPRFTGALLLAAEQDQYACLAWSLADGRTLVYRDVRRLGTVALLSAPAFGRWSAALGPEPLDPDLTAERFSGILRGSKRAVKSILMDQKRLAGIGNIYANESCWRARLKPARRGHTVTAEQAGTLLTEMRALLTESIALRGTTFRDYRDAYGQRGGFAARLTVYGRAGEPCVRCGTTLKESHVLEGRSTVWCPSCQR